MGTANRRSWSSFYPDLPGSHAVSVTKEEIVRELQSRLRPLPAIPKTHADFRRVARWLELEALRGYESSARSRMYARNQHWLAELAYLHGDGTAKELLSRVGLREFPAQMLVVDGWRRL